MIPPDVPRLPTARSSPAFCVAKVSIFSRHSFRVLVVTDLLSQDEPLEDVRYLAGHANPTTTQIYDRPPRRVAPNIVERQLRVSLLSPVLAGCNPNPARLFYGNRSVPGSEASSIL